MFDSKKVKVEQITTKDVSSGRLHHRLVVDGKTYTLEADNLDAAGEYTILPSGGRADRGDGVPIGTDPALLCKRCFPED